MARSLSALLTAHVAQDGFRFAWLYDIEVSDSVTLRLCKGNRNISWDSLTYYGAAIGHDAVRETAESERMSGSVIRIGDVGNLVEGVYGRMSAYVSADSGMTNRPLCMKLIGITDTAGVPTAVDDPDGAFMLKFYVESVQQLSFRGNREVHLQVRPRFSISGRLFPKIMCSALICRHRYRGRKCGFKGAQLAGPNSEPDYCSNRIDDDTYGCPAHINPDGTKNTTRFGGFPALAAARTIIR